MKSSLLEPGKNFGNRDVEKYSIRYIFGFHKHYIKLLKSIPDQ